MSGVQPKTSQEIANSLDDALESHMEVYGDTPIDKIPAKANEDLDNKNNEKWVPFEDYKALVEKLEHFHEWVTTTNWERKVIVAKFHEIFAQFLVLTKQEATK